MSINKVVFEEFHLQSLTVSRKPARRVYLFHDDPRGGVEDRKNPSIRPDFFVDEVRLETLSDLRRKEDPFGFLSALGIGQGNPGRIAAIGEAGIEGVLAEVEEGRQVHFPPLPWYGKV